MLRVVSVNIERRRHLDTVSAFLKAEKPDVLCLQEVQEIDLPLFQDIIGGDVHFAPKFVYPDGQIEGIAIISRFPFSATVVRFAGDETETLPIHDESTFERAVQTQWYQLLHARISANDKEFSICTTHLPVTIDGEVGAYQLSAIYTLIDELEKIQEFVIMGDMNAPRGQQSFQLLADKFLDNIPPEYESSIDPILHRAGHLKKMVDGCFSTPAYTVNQVRFQCGVSDHCAICVEIDTI